MIARKKSALPPMSGGRSLAVHGECPWNGVGAALRAWKKSRRTKNLIPFS